MSSEYSPTKVFKYCPQCGEPGLETDSPKSLKCKRCGFLYYINMSASVAVVIRNGKNEVLFTLRKHDPAQGLLDLPGGFVDPGETAEEAVVREIYEELNLKITTMQYMGTFTNTYLYSGIQYQTLDLVFNCSVVSFENIQVADDVSGYVFRDPATVPDEEIGLDSIRRVVKHLKTSR